MTERFELTEAELETVSGGFILDVIATVYGNAIYDAATSKRNRQGRGSGHCPEWVAHPPLSQPSQTARPPRTILIVGRSHDANLATMGWRKEPHHDPPQPGSIGGVSNGAGTPCNSLAEICGYELP